MKKILLIGDSIRKGYQESVIKKLEGKAQVFGPTENCKFAKNTLWYLDEYLELEPDIIHWNNGIWDVYHKDYFGEVFTKKKEYLYEIRRILSHLKTLNVPIIWATTTAVAYDCPYLDNGEIDERNEAVNQIMQENDIPINDLNAVIKRDIDNYIAPDKFHLSEEGVEACAKQVAQVLTAYLD